MNKDTHNLMDWASYVGTLRERRYVSAVAQSQRKMRESKALTPKNIFSFGVTKQRCPGHDHYQIIIFHDDGSQEIVCPVTYYLRAMRIKLFAKTLDFDEKALFGQCCVKIE